MKWECLYYTDGKISNKRTLSKLCLLFDSVRIFYLSPFYYLKPLEERWLKEKNLPFFKKSRCEKDLLTRIHFEAHKRFINDNHELIESGILQPIIVNQKPPDWESFEENEKKLMKDGSGIAFGIWGQSVGIVPIEKIYVDAAWFSLYRWQSISGGLHFAIQTGQSPISDESALSALACETVNRFSDFNPKPTSGEIASNIAFRSMSMFIPNFPSLKPEEILEARDRLNDELQIFRAEMLNISRHINEKTYPHIDSIIADKIEPRLDDIKLKIKSLNGELFRKLTKVFFVGGSVTSLVSYFLNLPLPVQIGVISSFVGKILLDIHENQSKRYEIRNQSLNRGLVFLLDIQKKYR